VRMPDFLIVGAPRCGTTAMKTYLEKHPEIFMPPAGDPEFFGTDLYYPMKVRNEQTYLSLFATAINEKRVGEKSANYLTSKRAAAEIKEFQPSASIIIMLRNPVEMIYSLHNYLFNLGFEDLDDFKAALEAEEDRKRGPKLPNGLDFSENWRMFYRDRARYTHQVKRFLDEIVDRINNDELKDIDLKTLSRVGVEICKMYGITWDKVLMRDGTLVAPVHEMTYDKAMAMLLAKGQADRDAADRLREEREAFKVMQAKGNMKDVTPSR